MLMHLALNATLWLACGFSLRCDQFGNNVLHCLAYNTGFSSALRELSSGFLKPS